MEAKTTWTNKIRRIDLLVNFSRFESLYFDLAEFYMILVSWPVKTVSP